MAFKVPQYEQQTRIDPAQVATPRLTPITEAAAGGQIGQAVVSFGKSLEGAADAVRGLEKKYGEAAANRLETEYRLAVQSVLHEKSTDENGRPVGLLNRALEQANGVTPDFDAKFVELRKHYLEQAPAAVRGDLARRLDAHFAATREGVIQHEVGQGKKAYEVAYESNIKQTIDDAAGLTSPDLLERGIADAVAKQSKALKTMGRDAEAEGAGKVLTAAMTEKAINAVLEQDPRQAYALLIRAQHGMGEDARVRLESAIDGKLFADKSVALWRAVAGRRDMKLSDGSYDLGKLRGEVEKLDEPVEKKEKLFNFLEARAAEDHRNTLRQDGANEREWYNATIKGFRAGVPGVELEKLAGGFGARDEKMVQDRLDILRGMYRKNGGSEKGDPESFVALWEGVRKGSVTRADLARARAAERITDAQFISLSQDIYNEVDEKNPTVKAAWERIDVLADSKFGSNKRKKAEFIYEMKATAAERKLHGDELWKAAQDKLKDDPTSGFLFWTDPQYKVDIERRDKQAAAWGSLYQAVGRDEVNAIGKGILLSGRRGPWGMGDVEAFAKEFGGLDKIARGTPANAAIQALVAQGQMVTPANVRYAMKLMEDARGQ